MGLILHNLIPRPPKLLVFDEGEERRKRQDEIKQIKKEEAAAAQPAAEAETAAEATGVSKGGYNQFTKTNETGKQRISWKASEKQQNTNPKTGPE